MELHIADRPKLQVGELGELFYDKPEPVGNVTTWVYEEGNFTPIAKLVNGERYSIISDYIGRRIQVFNANGEVVWETEYDIYGRLKNLKGEKSFIPFRQLGQYEDTETGLYYNRFRYYNPDAGTYLSQDPIGLLGGTVLYGYAHDSNAWVDIFGLDLVTVYHYTSDEGFKAISGSGKIKAGDPGARGKGAINKPKGVYVTKVKPEDLQKSGTRGKMGLTGKKSTHFIGFQVEESSLKKLDPQDSKLRLRIDGDVELRNADNKLKEGVSLGKVPVNKI